MKGEKELSGICKFNPEQFQRNARLKSLDYREMPEETLVAFVFLPLTIAVFLYSNYFTMLDSYLSSTHVTL